MDRIYDDVLYSRHHRVVDPAGRYHAVDEPADLAADHSEPLHIRLQEDHPG